MARRVRRALLPRLDWAPALCGNYGAASNHSSFCQLAPFNNTLLLCVIVFLCFEQFVIGAFILGLITATMPLFCFSMAEIGTQEDITDFGMIWMKQILISRQPGLKHTTDADQAGFTHLVIVDCSLENNIQLCSKSQLDMSRYRRGCDLRGEKAIRAKAGMWPYKKELFQALISWSAKCSENSGFAAVIIILLILQFIWSVDSCFVAAFKTGADALASKIQH